MFYVKQRITDEMEVNIFINDENVFCKCPECGVEHAVDLADIFPDGQIDLVGTSVLCERCTHELLHHE